MIVQNTGNFIRHIGDVRLIPGTNDVPAELVKGFQAAIDKGLNAELVKKGEIVVPGSKKGGHVEKTTDMSANDAIKSVNDTYDKALLDKWLSEEEAADRPRVSVVKAIQEQIELHFNPDGSRIVNPDE